MITLQPVKPEEWSAPRARAHTRSVLMHMHCRFCVAGTGEDPFLWRSARGWHMLYHGMCPSGVWQVQWALNPELLE